MYGKCLIGGFLLVTLFSCASNQLLFKLTKEEDCFELRRDGSILISDIYSVSGIGGTTLSLPKNNELISGVQLNLHVQQLEFMRVTSSNAQWVFSLPRKDHYPAPWSQRTRSGAYSGWRRWQPFLGEQGFGVTRNMNAVEVLLPAKWIEGKGSIQLEWIDWHR